MTTPKDENRLIKLQLTKKTGMQAELACFSAQVTRGELIEMNLPQAALAWNKEKARFAGTVSKTTDFPAVLSAEAYGLAEAAAAYHRITIEALLELAIRLSCGSLVAKVGCASEDTPAPEAVVSDETDHAPRRQPA